MPWIHLLDLGDGKVITMLHLFIKGLELNHMYLLSALPVLLLGQNSQQETHVRKEGSILAHSLQVQSFVTQDLQQLSLRELVTSHPQSEHQMMSVGAQLDFSFSPGTLA